MKQKATIVVTLLIMCISIYAEESSIWKMFLPLPHNTESEVSIMLGGDVMFHQPQIDAARGEDGVYDFSGSFRYIQDSWSDCDAVIFNLETTLSEGNYSGYPQFATPKEVAQNLRNCGVTHLMLANNHTCDKYANGIRNTIKFVEEAGIETAGSYVDSVMWRQKTPLYIKRDGMKIAVLNYTYGTNGIPTPKGMVVPKLDTTQMAKDIRLAKRESATNIIAFLHWGNEYQSNPSTAQKQLAKWLHDSGVDIIVGSHPHVIQPTHIDSTKVTIYSLGNLISNQRKRYTNGGLLIKLDIVHDIRSGKSNYKITHLPHFVYKAPLGDSPRYYCIPENMVDSIITEPAQRKEARVFFEDSKRLLRY